jgi:hypothetical protein
MALLADISDLAITQFWNNAPLMFGSIPLGSFPVCCVGMAPSRPNLDADECMAVTNT